MNRLSSPMMLSKCSMYLTLQRRTGLWLCLEKRIVGVENVVVEEEYNHFDEIPSFDTSYKPQLLGTNITPYLRSDHSETNRFSANGNPTLCTLVVVPGGLPRAIPCLSNTKNPYRKKTVRVQHLFITLIRVHLFGTCRVQVQQD
jgi:hypothetical protein